MSLKKAFIGTSAAAFAAGIAVLAGFLFPGAAIIVDAAAPLAIAGFFAAFTLGYLGFVKMAGEKEASRVKSKFLAKMSHEIRTPMNGIIGLNELFPRDNLTEQQLACLEDTEKLARGLLNILNDILDFSKIEAGTFELTENHYSIHELFDNLCSVQSFLAEGKSISFQTRRDANIPAVLYGDAARVNQIFANLTSNAIKYTNEGTINFSLRRGSHDGDKVDYLICVVDDTGIGIKPDQLKNLFDASTQFSSRINYGIEGTGLGLAITKNLVDMMGGFIEAESLYGEGSTFTVYIPLMEGDPAAVSKKRPPLAVSTGSVQVLVVDDMSANLMVAAGFLRRHHIAADLAESGFKALQRIREKTAQGGTYDLILMDHMMPDMDGVETMAKIRALAAELHAPSLADVPIVALSANAEKESRELFRKKGMNDFLAKPLERDELNAVLTKWLPASKIRFDSADAAGIEAETRTHRAAASVLDDIKINGVDGALDSSVGLYYAGGSWSGYIRILKSFVQQLDTHLQTMRTTRDAGDWSAFAVEAHAYKGILASIGYAPFSAWGKRLEAAAKAGDGETCRAEAEPFCQALEELRGKLIASDIFEKTAAAKEEVDVAVLKETLDAITRACERNSVSRVKEAAGRLARYDVRRAVSDEHAGELETAIEEILTLCEVMRYDEAVEKLKQISI